MALCQQPAGGTVPSPPGFTESSVAAGAGVADHLHTHIVPRWTGDTNFMTVVGGARVLPEEIGQSGERLRPVFARLCGAR